MALGRVFRPPSTLSPLAGPEDRDVEWAAVERARHDPRAFAPIYQRYADPVFRYCLRRLGEREPAEDAMARVFARALAKLPASRTGSVRSWLFTIAHNEVIDAYRTQRRHEPIDAAITVRDDEADPESAALRSEADDWVRAQLSTLTPDQRRVVELRLSGLTAPEIASVLGMGLSAVKMTQFRAFARLREALSVGAGEVSRGRR